MGQLTVGLFESTQEGVRLVGRSTAPGVVNAVREALIVERRVELARLASEAGPPVRLVRDEADSEDRS